MFVSVCVSVSVCEQVSGCVSVNVGAYVSVNVGAYVRVRVSPQSATLCQHESIAAHLHPRGREAFACPGCQSA